jgi:hypothetical protein
MLGVMAVELTMAWLMEVAADTCVERRSRLVKRTMRAENCNGDDVENESERECVLEGMVDVAIMRRLTSAFVDSLARERERERAGQRRCPGFQLTMK